MSTELVIKGLLAVQGNFQLEVTKLNVSSGEVLGIMGPSGAGKSTLLNVLSGFLPLNSGSIQVGNQEVSLLPPEKRKMAYVTQKAALFPHFSILENVAFPLRVRGMKKREREANAFGWLQKLGIEDLATRYPHQVSGGEAQRTAIARALISDFPVLFLDEPFSSLDVSLRVQLRSEVKRLVAETKVCALLVSHDPDDLLSLTERGCFLSQGKLTGPFPAKEVVAKITAGEGKKE